MFVCTYLYMEKFNCYSKFTQLRKLNIILIPFSLFLWFEILLSYLFYVYINLTDFRVTWLNKFVKVVERP